jgi:lipopolysaccharide/colanic/teichoic acid biosynthesis glycosyltransferase
MPMLKRSFDFVASLFGLILLLPLLLPVMFLVWKQDRHSPFYIAKRVGRGEKLFDMVKLRSMVINADKAGIDSTSAKDPRITAVGHFIRRYKLDELMQLWNVLKGDMSLVGPRPNVKRETDTYTAIEKHLLQVRPGITDLASIVFSDEGDILKDSSNPDLDYVQLIRPWKSRLALVSVEHSSVWLDLRVILLTVLAILSKQRALDGVESILRSVGADEQLINIAQRRGPLLRFPPPGATELAVL